MYNDFHVSSTNQKPKNGSNERVKLWSKNPLWSPILILNLFYGLLHINMTLTFKVYLSRLTDQMDVVKLDVAKPGHGEFALSVNIDFSVSRSI